MNVCIGALIIKELFQISDDEMVENLIIAPRYQYAPHTTNYDEQPLSDKTLSRFRKRCYDYESASGVDSLMIEANIKNLSRAMVEQTRYTFNCTLFLVLQLRTGIQNRKD